MTAVTPVPTDDLAAILADLWDRLEDAATRAKPAFHLPTLCTADAAGPTGRVVVLRYADRSDGPGTVGCHTDLRSPKVRELRADPRCAWVFYDRAAGLQVRLHGEAAVLTDGPDIDAAWAATAPSARRCYLAPSAPGTPGDEPDANVPPEFARRDPTASESAPGRANFAVIRTAAESVDWLWLHHAGHRRARFARAPDGWVGNWVAV